MIIIIMSKELH